MTPAVKRPLTYTYFAITAKIMNGKIHSGYRKRIYEDAVLYVAFYDVRQPDKSIWYPDDSDDLYISLMFAEEREAQRFLACLIKYNVGHTLLKGCLEVNKIIDTFESGTKGVYVYSDDYKFEDSDSPANTHDDDIQSTTEVSCSGDPVQALRSLEDLSQVHKGEGIFRCHIAPQAFYKEYRNDPDNIIFGSHLFHNYFDGDGKRRPPPSHAGWGTPPRLKIEYESTGNSHMYQSIRYYLINVLVTFEDPEMARAMDGRWREGSSAVGDLQFRTHFYTGDAERAQNFLALKLKETEARWAYPTDLEEA